MIAGDPARFYSLKAIFAIADEVSAGGFAGHSAAVLPSIFNTLWEAASGFASFRILGLAGGRIDLTLVNPDFYADTAVSCLGFRKTIINVRTQGLQRDRSFVIVLVPCNIQHRLGGR